LPLARAAQLPLVPARPVREGARRRRGVDRAMSARAELLQARRWFRSKARRVIEVEERDRAEVGGAPLCLWEARFEGGGAEVYLVGGERDAVDPAAIVAAIARDLRVEGERGAFVFRRGRGF